MLPVALPCDVKNKKINKNKKEVVIDYNIDLLLTLIFYPLIIVHYLKFVVKNIVDITILKCNYSSCHDLSRTYDL